MTEKLARTYVQRERWITLAFVIVVPILVTIGLLWREGRIRFEEVQHSRAEVTYISCLEQNQANADTVKLLDDALANRRTELETSLHAAEDAGNLPKVAAITAQLDALGDQRDFTVSLIDALRPVRDCQALVTERFGFVPDLPPPEEES